MKMLYTNLVQLKRLLKTDKIFPFGQCHVIHPYIHCLDTSACCCDSVTEKWTESPWYDVRATRWLTESSQYYHTPALLTRINLWRCVCQLILKLHILLSGTQLPTKYIMQFQYHSVINWNLSKSMAY